MGAIENHAHERRWLILAVLCISLLIIVLDNSILNVAIPTIAASLQASDSELQWIIDSYSLVFAGLLLTSGTLGDRYGRRGMLQLGFLTFGAGSVASALSGTAGMLIASRGLMGVGAALIMPSTLSIITNLFTGAERGRAIGFWAGVAGLAAALGPITGGFLLEHFYWGSVFLVNVPIVIVSLVAGVVLIPTSKDPHPAPLDPVGAVLSMAGLSALLYALIEAPAAGWASARTGAAIAIGVAVLGAFSWWELRRERPMLELPLFRKPAFGGASAVITLVFFAIFGMLYSMSQYLQFVLGYSPLETGIRVLPYAVTMAVVPPVSARVVERHGTRRTVGTGLLAATAGLVALSALTTTSSYPDIVWRLVLFAAGLGLIMAPSTASVMGALPPTKAGMGSAVNDTTRQLGASLGVAVVGSVVSSAVGPAIGGYLDGAGAPPAIVAAARGGLGQAAHVSSQVRLSGLPRAGELADGLMRTAGSAFVEGMSHGLLVAAAATALAAVVAFLVLPTGSPRPVPVAAGTGTAPPANGSAGGAAPAAAPPAAAPPHPYQPAGAEPVPGVPGSAGGPPADAPRQPVQAVRPILAPRDPHAPAAPRSPVAGRPRYQGAPQAEGSGSLNGPTLSYCPHHSTEPQPYLSLIARPGCPWCQIERQEARVLEWVQRFHDTRRDSIAAAQSLVPMAREIESLEHERARLLQLVDRLSVELRRNVPMAAPQPPAEVQPPPPPPPPSGQDGRPRPLPQI